MLRALECLAMHLLYYIFIHYSNLFRIYFLNCRVVVIVIFLLILILEKHAEK